MILLKSPPLFLSIITVAFEPNFFFFIYSRAGGLMTVISVANMAVPIPRKASRDFVSVSVKLNTSISVSVQH